jgi:hypothetical protein
MVLEADTAVLHREGDRFPLPVVAGEVLFPGDRITAVRGSVELVRCSDQGRGEHLTLTGGTVLLGREGDDRYEARITAGSALY